MDPKTLHWMDQVVWRVAAYMPVDMSTPIVVVSRLLHEPKTGILACRLVQDLPPVQDQLVFA